MEQTPMTHSQSISHLTIHGDDEPEEQLDLWLQEHPMRSDSNNTLLAVSFSFTSYWLEEPETCELLAIYECEARDGQQLIRAMVCEQPQKALTLLNEGEVPSLVSLSAQLKLPVIPLSGPILLGTVAIAKPWGQEIWYTGIEARGVSTACVDEYASPLPWVIALAPRRLLNTQSRNPILLKVLDPLPEEVYGDLYFEMHEKKQEVYVVTHIDKTAWPESVGAIRFGFNEARLASAATEEQFIAEYRQAVQDYANVRRHIDEQFDQLRYEAGFSLSEPVPVEQLKLWQSALPEALVSQERERRRIMDDFTQLRGLEVGDVVQVPCFTPHALQHGVRSIEFQTPVYERQILSFAQKTLTQAHWDTDEALEKVHLQPQELRSLQALESTDECQIDRIVDFSDFEVLRIRLAPHCCYELQSRGVYALVMAVGQKLRLANVTLLPSQACLIPASQSLISLRGEMDKNALFLVAYPKESM